MDNKIIILLGYFIHLALGSCGQKDKGNCQEFNEQYAKIYSKSNGKPDTLTLMKALNEIIVNDRKCVDAYLTRGDIYFSIDQSSNAKNDFQQVLRLDTANVYALYQMGLLYQYEGLHDSSIYVLNKAIKIKTHGNMLIDYPQVTNELSTSDNKYDVESTEIIYRQGVNFYYKRNLELSKSYFNYCINSKYLLDKVYLYTGAISIELNDKKKACEYFLKAKDFGNIDALNYIEKYCN